MTSIPTRHQVLPFAAAATAAVIFVFDTLSPLGMAVAVLYVLVVLLVAGFSGRRGIVLATIGCGLLAATSYLIGHGHHFTEDATARLIVSLAAIGVTAGLVLRYKAAAQALVDQARLLDLTHDTVFVRDAESVITYWNRAAEELYGWSREEAVGRVSHELLQTTFPVPLPVIDAELLRAGHWQGELVHTRRDGGKVTLSSRWALQRDARGRPVAVLETNTDITERRQAEEALAQAQAELAHVTRMTTLGELTASIAHEVNQPLAAIVTNGEAGLRWLTRSVPDLGEVRSAIERMIADGRRASDVVWRLRAMARKGTPRHEPVALREVVEEAIVLVQREIERQDVTLQVEVAPDLPPASGDRIQLQQVLINLLVNGVQAMAASDRPRELSVRARPGEAGMIEVSVDDTGPGLAEENAGRLFNPFYTTKADGMGMGLSICRSIVEAHGGLIFAANHADRPGAAFRFTLPIHAEAAS